MKAAPYARYSSDLQNESSIEDQLRINTECIESRGWTLYKPYMDYAISGASLIRPGIQALLQDAMNGQFDVVVVEDLDRISRDQEDMAGVYKRLTFAGVQIFSLADGFINELHVGLKGTVNAIQLKQISAKVRRGQRGRVEAGKIPGGNSYGYLVLRNLNADGEPIKGERAIDKSQAKIVRRIFEEYAVGHSPKAIAKRLNEDKIAGPTGKQWSQSTINGNRRRGTGILNNELYVGKLVYNRLRYIKDPDTGKRVSRLNPENKWITHDLPELRIIADDLWKRVKSRQKDLDTDRPQFWKKQRPRNLFSYLLKCGECGGGFSMVSATHAGCSNARNKGTCENRLTIKRIALEESVLETLKNHLMDERRCELFCREYTAYMNKLRMDHNASLHSYRRELQKLERDRDKIIQSIKDGVPGSVVKDEAIRIEDRKAELEQLLDDCEEAAPLFHPNMALRYHEEVQRLILSLNTDDHRAEASELLRSLIDRIVLTPDHNRTKLTVDLQGDLAGILSVAVDSEKQEVTKHLNRAANGTSKAAECGSHPPFWAHSQDKLVAGAGFEPATFRL